MAKYKVLHFRKDCISCGACAAIAPEFWEMDDEGLAHLKGSKQVDDHYERDIDTEADKAQNEEASQCCPVSIIHVKKLEKELEH